jgi:hypothetical protein
MKLKGKSREEIIAAFSIGRSTPEEIAEAEKFTDLLIAGGYEDTNDPTSEEWQRMVKEATTHASE